MSLTFFITFGLLAGLVANLSNPQIAHEGWLGPILLAALGAFIGGTIGSLLMTNTNLVSLVAVIGGVALLAAQRIVRQI